MNLLYDDKENLAEKHVDTNKDCKFDQFVYYLDGKPEKAEVDSNHDGRLDTWTFYETDGETLARRRNDGFLHHPGRVLHALRELGYEPVDLLRLCCGESRRPGRLVRNGGRLGDERTDLLLDGRERLLCLPGDARGRHDCPDLDQGHDQRGPRDDGQERLAPAHRLSPGSRGGVAVPPRA